jgi:hypothetical protein
MQIPRAALAVVLLAATGCGSVAHRAAQPPRTGSPAQQASSPPPAPEATRAARPAPSDSTSATTPTSRSTSTLTATPLPYASDAYPSAAPAIAAGVVPWADLPYHSPVDPDPRAHPPGTPAWCTNADVVVGKGGPGDGAGGALEFGWPLLARPGHRCSLQGYATVRMSDARHTWSLTSDAPDSFGVPSGAVVDEKHPGRLAFRWGTDPSGYSPDVGRGLRLLTFGLPHDGGRLTLTDSTLAWEVPGRTLPATPLHLGRISVVAVWGEGKRM